MELVDLSKDPKKEKTLFKTSMDTIKGKFHFSSNGDFIEKIELTSSTMDKKIHRVTYCNITDAIEIHYFRNTQDKFVPKIKYPLKDCRLNSIRILLLDYADNEIPKKCASANDSIIVPGTSKGSVIVGNP